MSYYDISGFLSTGDNVVPGNMGLRDQVTALKWIRRNIKYFGGNSDSITITGLSAGAASVHFHYFSSKSKNLFNRGFSESGSSLNYWALSENATHKANILGTALGCSTNTSKILIKCLKIIPAYDIITATVNSLYAYPPFNIVPFGPVVESNSSSSFLPEHPYELLQKGKVLDVTWLTVISSHDGYANSLCKSCLYGISSYVNSIIDNLK